MEYIVSERFYDEVDKAVNVFLKEEDGRKITVIHHNDADGICSAVLQKVMLEELNVEYEFICVEKVYPEIIQKIHSERHGIFIYTDLGGLASRIIAKETRDGCHSFIIDHHPAKDVDGNNITILDPELAGISGDIFISASTLNYIFAQRVTEKIKDYAYIALLGAVGDYHDRYGGVLGFDRYVLSECVSLGQVEIRIEGMKERYYIKKFGEYADPFSRRLTTLGSVGYLKKGYMDGMRACFEGFDSKTMRKVKKLEEIKQKKFQREIERLSNGLNETEKVQWFNVENRFSPMGVKTIGEFCQQIKDMSFTKPLKYLIGFQDIPDVIPDLGKLSWKGVKVSARAPSTLERMILNGKVPGYDFLIPKASELVGGYADATHKIAAATVIDKGKEEDFVYAIEEVLKNEDFKAC